VHDDDRRHSGSRWDPAPSNPLHESDAEPWAERTPGAGEPAEPNGHDGAPSGWADPATVALPAPATARRRPLRRGLITAAAAALVAVGGLVGFGADQVIAGSGATVPAGSALAGGHRHHREGRGEGSHDRFPGSEPGAGDAVAGQAPGGSR
jgi:hypothetical protein